MELQTAIEILEYHQEWRLGKRDEMTTTPKQLTEALDIVISEVKKNRLGDIVEQSELLKVFVDRWNDKNSIACSPVIHDGFINEFLKSL